MSGIKALPQLQGMDAVIAPDGEAPIKELSTWASDDKRRAALRAQDEALALSGMGLDELHLFLARAAHDAIKSWNAQQSFFGRISNMMTISFVGYAQVPGRVFAQIMAAVGDNKYGIITPSASYLMRADIAADLRDQIAALRKQTR